MFKSNSITTFNEKISAVVVAYHDYDEKEYNFFFIKTIYIMAKKKRGTRKRRKKKTMRWGNSKKVECKNT